MTGDPAMAQLVQVPKREFGSALMIEHDVRYKFVGVRDRIR